MLQFSKLLAASMLLLAATGPGLTQASNPYANMKPYGSQPAPTAARVSPTPLKSNSYYNYQRAMSNTAGSSIVGIPAPKPPPY